MSDMVRVWDASWRRKATHEGIRGLSCCRFWDIEVLLELESLMEKRKFSREFKLEAVRLVRERGVAVAQAARDLDLHVNVLRTWVCEQSADPQQASPGHGQMKPQQAPLASRPQQICWERAAALTG